VENPEWTRGNGISVLASEYAVTHDSFILSMSDHVVSPSAIKRVVESASAANLLCVDPRIADVYDIDDATKVRLEGDNIGRIAKTLENYNGIDCGLFRLNGRFFDSMREQLKSGRDSISAGIDGLIQNGDMAAVFLESSEEWIDIDTPDAYRHALESFRK
jgi:choline kinase